MKKKVAPKMYKLKLKMYFKNQTNFKTTGNQITLVYFKSDNNFSVYRNFLHQL